MSTGADVIVVNVAVRLQQNASHARTHGTDDDWRPRVFLALNYAQQSARTDGRSAGQTACLGLQQRGTAAAADSPAPGQQQHHCMTPWDAAAQQQQQRTTRRLPQANNGSWSECQVLVSYD